jgi:hypothetical protein
MRTSLIGVVLVLSGVAITVSCGGDDGDNDNGSGASNTGATSSGGSSAGNTNGGTNSDNGGSNTTQGGDGNPAGGAPGSPQGGQGNGEGGGDFSFGGAFSVDQCEASVMNGGDCESMPGQGPATCQDDSQICICLQSNWNCIDTSGQGGGTSFPGFGGQGPMPVECPDARPETGESCSGFGFCPYDGGNCICDLFSGSWQCF